VAICVVFVLACAVGAVGVPVIAPLAFGKAALATVPAALAKSATAFTELGVAAVVTLVLEVESVSWTIPAVVVVAVPWSPLKTIAPVIVPPDFGRAALAVV
jgi:hypothetical protein